MAKELWVEKYRPKEFEDIVGLDADFVSLIKRDMPHLLLIGRAGTGKTTLAKVIIKQEGYEYLTLNASDERGIDVVREKVKMFASTRSINGKIKIIFLDEADYLTPEAQNSLRNIIESFDKVCRFILTGNYINRLAEPLRSRCTLYEFSTPNKEKIMERLKSIVDAENVEVSKEAVKILIDVKYPDMRSMINTLQRLSIKGKITEEDIAENAMDITAQIYAMLKEKNYDNFLKARALYLDNALHEAGVVRELYEIALADTGTKNGQKVNIIHHLAECQKALPIVAIKQIQIESTMLKIMGEFDVR